MSFILMNFPSPRFLTASNTAIVLSIGLVADGTVVLVQGKSRLPLVFGLTAFTIVFWELAQWLAPTNVVIRVIAATLIYTSLYTWLLLELFYNKMQIGVARTGMIYVIIAHIIVLIARMIISISHPEPNFVFSSSFLPWFLFENAAIMILNFFFVMITIGGKLDDALKQRTMSLAAERHMHGQLRQFLGMLGHELRTPLTIIDRSAELSQELLPPEQSAINRRLKTIRSAVERARGLMDNLIIEERAQIEVSDAQPIDVNRLVHDLIRFLSNKYEDNRIALAVHSNLNFVQGNREMLAAAIGNILDNALKYSRPDQTINIIVQSDENHGDVVLTVIDHGIGFPPHQISEIGKRFFRADNAGAVQGTGLGLSIVKTVIEKHNGTVTFENGDIDGAIVTIRLPNITVNANATVSAANRPLPA